MSRALASTVTYFTPGLAVPVESVGDIGAPAHVPCSSLPET